MSESDLKGPEPFWKTARLLWKNARRRALSRTAQRRKMLRRRKTRSSDIPSSISTIGSALLCAMLHGFLASITIENTDFHRLGRSDAPPLTQLCGTLLFLWWFVMLVMQGEGLELDVQRRRHPM